MKSRVSGKILDPEMDWQAEGLSGLLWMTISSGLRARNGIEIAIVRCRDTIKRQRNGRRFRRMTCSLQGRLDVLLLQKKMYGYSIDLGRMQALPDTTGAQRNGRRSDRDAVHSNWQPMTIISGLAAPNDGLRRFHFASGTWARFRDIKGLLHNHVGEYGLAVDEDYVWVGTLRGLSRYDKQKESWTPLTALPTLRWTHDSDDRYRRAFRLGRYGRGDVTL